MKIYVTACEQINVCLKYCPKIYIIQLKIGKVKFSNKSIRKQATQPKTHCCQHVKCSKRKKFYGAYIEFQRGIVINHPTYIAINSSIYARILRRY